MEDFNLYPIHVFRMVARLGSVTLAARELKVSQPAVSAHLRSLENRYGCPLLERTARGMKLTSAGEILVDSSNHVFSMLDDMEEAIASDGMHLHGEVIISASSVPSSHILPPLMTGFQPLFPDVKLTPVCTNSRSAENMVLDFRSAIGILGDPPTSQDISSVKIGEDQLRLMTSTEDQLCRIKPIRDEYFRDRTLLIREPGSSTRAVTERMLGSSISHFGRVIEMNDPEAIKQSVISGFGISVLSALTIKLEESAGLIRAVRDDRFAIERSFYMIRRADRKLIGAAESFWNYSEKIRSVLRV